MTDMVQISLDNLLQQELDREKRAREEYVAAVRAREEAEKKLREQQIAEVQIEEVKKGLNFPKTLSPRPYQIAGAVHLRSKRKAMIYDQPGLGKTLQGCMALVTPAVISCPGYLVDQWADFMEAEYPQWSIGRVSPTLLRAARQEVLSEKHDVYVVNHEMFATRQERFTGGREPRITDAGYTYAKWMEWQRAKAAHNRNAGQLSYEWPKVKTLILDESHHFRNREAKQSISVAHYADLAEYVYLLTATPQYKDITNWWHQLRIMDPRNYTRYQPWVDWYTYRTGWNNSLIKIRSDGAPKKLQEEIAKYAIGRTYDEVGLFLPDLIESNIKVNWHPDVLRIYKDVKNNARISTGDGNALDIDPGAVLHTLRTVTACPEKVDAVKQIVADIPGEEPIIIFCWYRDTAELLWTEFYKSPSSTYIHGEFSQKERLERAKDKDTRIKCVTMSSASEGVDWSDASTVIFFEEDYTPGKMYQALSRVRRFSKDGKKRPVICYYIHMKNSVDEDVHEAVTQRNGDARRILRRALK